VKMLKLTKYLKMINAMIQDDFSTKILVKD
jgi:hypothetical protein